jgi:hypothetical protein
MGRDHELLCEVHYKDEKMIFAGSALRNWREGKTGFRVKNPAHPGGLVKSEIVEAPELSVTDAARRWA